ncbi:MAG: LysR family transcriptional regulator [Roseibium album]|uniref:D-malate degradation protein R n=1 Tax=Roseibium album TaxID=311410 RepID=A0A0M7A6P4_9HYPH|nr:LysR family transcriptional regulator [Roseibium album]MBG6175914.1 DNA-binding transcriptional LysR family regulator [Labrenzia sp. EL_132]MBG6204384.1 DNA-binding transcriptional LysR family regulator [Labrenzia sp. EL_13]MBG6208787.1 DNA-binding transcriptional LysR family regulator [Labrenzia sp. EL_126]MBG6230325.1 DNA-binding transcriptional LysR family regulator [Labrenzia sp. EL_208]MCR9059249.1 LysR family transcriptional regulator [Paracoccaceae bacterium]
MDAITRMRCFIQVVDSSGFSAAAREMGRSKALVSKYVGELEDELGVRLLNRTTRQVSLTEVGEAYYKEAAEILQRIDDLQASVQSSHQEVRGRLRVSAPRSMEMLDRAMMEFVVRYPEIYLDLRLEDRFVDLVEEGFDIAVRVTQLEDSSLIARKVAPIRTVVCASPQAIEKYGTPNVPSDLASRPCIIDTNYRFKQNWAFEVDGERQSVAVKGPVEVNSGSAAREAALCHLGFLRAPLFFIYEDIEKGDLKIILESYEEPTPGIYAVYPHRRHLSAKVRAFVDFLVEWSSKNPGC